MHEATSGDRRSDSKDQGITMFKFDKTDMHRFVVSGVAALAMSATCIFAAVGPAKAATATPTQQVMQIAAR